MEPHTTNDIGDADLIAYMCYDPIIPGHFQTIGIAYRGVNCYTTAGADKIKQSINEWVPTAVGYGGVN